MIRSSVVRLTLAAAVALLFAQTSHAESDVDCRSVATPDQRQDEDTIRRIEQDWLSAEYRGNTRFLECLLEADYRTSGRDGKVRTRADVIGHFAKPADPAREVPKLEVVVFVHGAAASAHSILRTTDKEGQPKEVHFVDAYTFHDGRWFAYGGADL